MVYYTACTPWHAFCPHFRLCGFHWLYTLIDENGGVSIKQRSVKAPLWPSRDLTSLLVLQEKTNPMCAGLFPLYTDYEGVFILQAVSRRTSLFFANWAKMETK